MSSLSFRVAVRSDFPKLLKLDAKIVGIAISHSARQATARFKRRLRAEVRAVGLGGRLANTIRSASKPQKGETPDVRGIVFSKAIYKRPGGLVDLIAVFDEGATIRAVNGKYLVIPIGAGKKEKFRFDKERMRMVPTARGGFLVTTKAPRGAVVPVGTIFKVLWLLTPVARIRPRRFGIDALVASANAEMAELAAEKWDKYQKRLGGAA